MAIVPPDGIVFHITIQVHTGPRLGYSSMILTGMRSLAVVWDPTGWLEWLSCSSHKRRWSLMGHHDLPVG